MLSAYLPSKDVFDWALAGVMTSTPIWLPPLSQVNEVLAFFGFLGGLILTAMKIGEHIMRNKEDDRKKSSRN